MSAHPSSAEAIRQIAALLDSFAVPIEVERIAINVTRENLSAVQRVFAIKFAPQGPDSVGQLGRVDMDGISLHFWGKPQEIWKPRQVPGMITVYGDADDAAETAAGGV